MRAMVSERVQLTVTPSLQLSNASGVSKLTVSPSQKVRSAVVLVNTGAIVSTTEMICKPELLFPLSSVAVHLL